MRHRAHLGTIIAISLLLFVGAGCKTIEAQPLGRADNPTRIFVDGVTITGNGTSGSPLVSSGGGANTALSNLAAVAVNAALLPGTSDSIALGSASKQWSDVFLGSGAVINVANGDWAATHSSGVLTVGTGDLRVTTAGTDSASAVTVGGTQTLSNKTLVAPALGTPASGVATNLTGTAAGLTAGAATALAANPADCSVGQFANAIASNGDLTCSSPAGGGDFVGPASSTDNAVVRFDGTTGKLGQNSAVTIADTSGDITGGKYNGLTVTSTTGTLTLANGSTLATSGANGLTLTSTGTTNVTLPTSGTLYGTAAGSISSADLLGSLSDETGSGLAVFATSPSLTSPAIGAATGASLVLTGNVSAEQHLVEDSDASHYLALLTTSNLTANRNFTLVPGDAARTLTMAGNINVGNDFITAGGHSLTLTTTGTTDVTLPTSGTLVNTAVTTLSSLASIGTVTTGVWSATDVALATGGTGATLADPNADRIFFWDDSAGSTDWLAAGNGLTVTTTTIAADTASDTVDGVVELATAAETTAGTDATRAVTPDGFAGSDYGKRVVEVKVFDDATAATTGDGKIIWFTPVEMSGYNLVDVECFVTGVSSSGALTMQIRNVTQAADMLSTAVTIDVSENSSLTAATPPAIDGANDDVATGDLIAVDVDGAGTSAEGLGCVASFQLP